LKTATDFLIAYWTAVGVKPTEFVGVWTKESGQQEQQSVVLLVRVRVQRDRSRIARRYITTSIAGKRNIYFTPLPGKCGAAARFRFRSEDVVDLLSVIWVDIDGGHLPPARAYQPAAGSLPRAAQRHRDDRRRVPGLLVPRQAHGVRALAGSC